MKREGTVPTTEVDVVRTVPNLFYSEKLPCIPTAL